LFALWLIDALSIDAFLCGRTAYACAGVIGDTLAVDAGFGVFASGRTGGDFDTRAGLAAFALWADVAIVRDAVAVISGFADFDGVLFGVVCFVAFFDFFVGIDFDFDLVCTLCRNAHGECPIPCATCAQSKQKALGVCLDFAIDKVTQRKWCQHTTRAFDTAIFEGLVASVLPAFSISA
jgi:hypothetical protein